MDGTAKNDSLSTKTAILVDGTTKKTNSSTKQALFVDGNEQIRTMKKDLLKNIGIYAGIVLLLAAVAYSFVPQVFDGKIVNQSDIAGWKGMAHETLEYNKANPEDPTAWTGSMFGGMPTTAIVDNFEGDWTKPIYKLLMFGKRPGSYLFVTLLGAFLLMLSLGVSKTLAIAGAIAVAFCSYNLQIIQVGHNTKMQAIAFFPWVLAGVIFTYRAALGGRFFNSQPLVRKDDEKAGWKTWLPKTMLGAVLFSLALSMQIKANHIQITYYLAIVIFIYAIALLISLCIDKAGKALLKRFVAASALLLVIGCIGIATNANKLIPTYEYTPYTMRGGSELASDSDSHNSKGLNLDYATAWSYGIEEMPNLLIPNFNGGSSSGPLKMDSETGKLLKRAGQPNLRQTLKAMPLYWGPQPFTAGPMYMGAITIFLFILGLALLKGREKWWVLAATLIAVLLAWGSHFMWFTKLWFDYAPFYNKFRTVSMALIVLQVTMPMLGFYVLDKVLKGGYDFKQLMKGGLIAYAVTAGFCLICAIAPGIAGTFTGSVDAGQPDILVDALIADRQMLLKADAIRSFVLISICFALIMWAVRGKDSSKPGYKTAAVGVAVALIVLFDLFSIGKRYLNSGHFITPKNFEAQYEPRPVDETLFEDDDPNYRVLDISINTFNSSLASYHHKTIGGYSPVKLQRYQDLIDKYIVSEIRRIYGVVDKSETVQEVSSNLPFLRIISLLNGKYIILGGDYPPVENPYAMGHCWFVEGFVPAETPDEEIALLAGVDLGKEAVMGKDFEWAIEVLEAAKTSGVTPRSSTDMSATPADHIRLTHYAPNELRYSYSATSDRPAIFSEIYYPKGWKAWIEPAGAYGEVRGGHYEPTAEAQPLELFRADWMLRGAIIPEGEGEIVMRFEPDSYQVGENISRASSIVLLLLLLLSVGGMVLSEFKGKAEA